MAFGILISTTRGVSDLANITTLRRTYTTRRTTVAGDIALPADIAVTSAIVAVRSHDGEAVPHAIINATTKRLVWQDSQSTDFSIDIYRKD